MLTPHVTPCARIAPAAGPAAVVDQDDLLAALRDAPAGLAALAAREDLRVEDVRVVAVGDVVCDRRAVEDALRTADLAAVRSGLRASGLPALGDALDRDRAAVADVVAVEVLHGGEVVLFVR